MLFRSALHLSAAAASQLHGQLIALHAQGSHPGAGLIVMNQVAVAGGAMGAQAAQQLHRLQQVRLPFAVAADHQQPRRLEIQLQRGDIAELAQLQAGEPNGSRAV